MKYNEGLGDAIEHAAEALPDDWTIEIIIEQGTAFVRLEDPEYNGVQLDCAGLTLAEEVELAVSVAIAELVELDEQ